METLRDDVAGKWLNDGPERKKDTLVERVPAGEGWAYKWVVRAR